MKKNLFLLFLSFIVLNASANAHIQGHERKSPPSYKEQKIIDNRYKDRLNLTEEQVQILKENRKK